MARACVLRVLAFLSGSRIDAFPRIFTHCIPKEDQLRILDLMLLGVICASACCAQQTPPDAPSATTSSAKPARSSYSPPTQSARFKTYITHTYGVFSILEAGARGGIDQARDRPSQWPQGGQGYADRFGSGMGEIAVRGTTEYLLGDIFREDLRFMPCRSACSDSKIKAALQDTFTARKGEDGHRAFSVARLVGPLSGAAVATNTWYPSGYGGTEIARKAGYSYGFAFARNLIRELTAH